MVNGTAGVITAVFGPLVRVQMGTEAVVVPFRRRLIWRGERGERRLVVGDRVVLEGTNPSMVVSEVEPRQSLLTRRSPGERRSRVLAANIDQAVVVLAAVSPEPNTRLLDRLLVACHHAEIHPLICINKIDKGLGDADSWLPDYHTAGYQVFMASARTARGIGTLTRALNGKTTLFCGPSGVGKSALLNAIHPGYRLKEGSISEATGKGRHTTSTTQLLPLPDGGFVVDTPGVKEFGFWEIAPTELPALFPEVPPLAEECAHADCCHLEDDGCAVRRGAEQAAISPRRYSSYVAMRRELEETARG